MCSSDLPSRQAWRAWPLVESLMTSEMPSRGEVPHRGKIPREARQAWRAWSLAESWTTSKTPSRGEVPRRGKIPREARQAWRAWHLAKSSEVCCGPWQAGPWYPGFHCADSSLRAHDGHAGVEDAGEASRAQRCVPGPRHVGRSGCARGHDLLDSNGRPGGARHDLGAWQ